MVLYFKFYETKVNREKRASKRDFQMNDDDLQEMQNHIAIHLKQ